MSLPIFYLKDVSISFDNNPFLRDINLQLYNGDRVAIVGRNGAGKSTLIKTMLQKLDIDKGEIFCPTKYKIGYLPQDAGLKGLSISKDITIIDYVLGGISLKEHETLEEKTYLAEMILNNIALKETDKLYKLSGGKLRRTFLAKALVEQPDILFLDEPTNHLDIYSIEWLEEYLNNFKGGLILISHDRQFLKNISNRMIWVDRGIVRSREKGFSHYEDWSEEIYQQEERELSKLGKELEKEQHWLNFGVTARRKRNQQRLRNLYQLREKLKSAQSNSKTSRINFEPLSESQKSKLVLELDNVNFEYTDCLPHKPIIKNLSLRLIRGECLGLVGKNGIGKSTILNVITGKLQPTSGNIYINPNLKISYFDQNLSELDDSKTLWEILCPNGGDQIFVNGNYKHVVAYLKDFMFNPKQAKARLSTLSGGERNRLLLAKTLANPGDFLIIDEPTNDLDMDTLDMLHDILSDYKGTILLVSHDRDFLDRLVTKTIWLDDNLVYKEFIGSYYNYREEEKITKKKPLKYENSRYENSRYEKNYSNKTKAKISYNMQREYETIPDQIKELLIQIKLIEKRLLDPDLYYKNLDEFNDLTNNLDKFKNKIESLEKRWLEIEEKKEEI